MFDCLILFVASILSVLQRERGGVEIFFMVFPRDGRSRDVRLVLRIWCMSEFSKSLCRIMICIQG